VQDDCEGEARCVTNPYSREQFCTRPCSRANPCPDFYECYEGQCVPPALSCIPPSDGGFCDACRQDLDCRDGYCLFDEFTGDGTCSPICTADPTICPTGGQCLPVVDQDGQFVDRICLPNRACVDALDCRDVQCEADEYCIAGVCRSRIATCEECQPGTPMRCGNGSYCVRFGGDDYCLPACDQDPASCPEGYACTDATIDDDVAFRYCAPVSGSCSAE